MQRASAILYTSVACLSFFYRLQLDPAKNALNPRKYCAYACLQTVNRRIVMSGRTSVISFRVTDDEKERIEVRAKAKNLKITAYARELVTGFDPDVVATRSRATIDQQERALNSLSESVTQLETHVRQVGKRIRSDAVMVIISATVAGFLFLLVGGVLGYGASLLFG